MLPQATYASPASYRVTRASKRQLDVQIVTDAQVIVTNVSFRNRDLYGIVGYVRCTGRPAFAEPAQPHPNKQHTTQPTQTSYHHHSLFRESGDPCQNAVRCYAARVGASFRFSAAQHPNGPSILLGPLSLVEARTCIHALAGHSSWHYRWKQSTGSRS